MASPLSLIPVQCFVLLASLITMVCGSLWNPDGFFGYLGTKMSGDVTGAVMPWTARAYSAPPASSDSSSSSSVSSVLSSSSPSPFSFSPPSVRNSLMTLRGRAGRPATTAFQHNNQRSSEVVEEEDEEGDSTAVEWRDMLSETLGSPTAKVMYGIGGIAVTGGVALRYCQRYLQRVYREKFRRHGSALTDLLGHVLLKNSKKGGGMLQGIYDKAIGVKGGGWWTKGFAPALTEHVATGDVMKGKVMAVYINGGALEQYLSQSGYSIFTPQLERLYNLCKQKGDSLEVVYASIDDKHKTAAKHFEHMPWYAVPFDQPDRVKQLIRQLGVRTLPAVVLVDESGYVINDKAYNAMITAPSEFPWKRKSVTQLLGDSFITPKNETVAYSSLDDKVLALYFGAERVPACKQFTPALKATYQALQAKEDETKQMEVIFVSNDKDQAQFKDNFVDKMPWLSIPFDDKTRRTLLQDALDVRVLPTLVLLDRPDRNGKRKILSRRAAAAVTKDAKAELFPWTPKPVVDVSESLDGLTENPSIVVFMEGLGADEQEKITQTMTKVSQEMSAKADEVDEPLTISRLSSGTNRRLSFITATKLDPKSEALRLLCKMPSAQAVGGSGSKARSASKPSLVLLDLDDQSFYKPPAAVKGVDETSIGSFVDMFQSQQLRREAIDLDALK
eukprot:GHVS01055778.1.p1 GENE.GHVS01055778.1~~GHVS01055778.1.p1  ORF type:complete len:673 (+),score=133.46 GHVS01055778.1:86-2104(+)